MKKYYLITPGPTPVPNQVALSQASPILHHRTDEFGKVFAQVMEDLKYVFQTKQDVLLFTSSGTGVMEACCVNLLSRRDKVLVASSGAFGDRWTNILRAHEIEPEELRFEWGKPVEPDMVEKFLKKNPSTSAVFITFTETSTGTVNDVKSLASIVEKTDAVLVVDAISGLGGEDLRMDEWKVDCICAASQKGLMTPPGLGFVSLTEKAWKKAENSSLPRFYWDFKNQRKKIADGQTPYTPAVSLVVALRQALKMIREETLERIFLRHASLSLAAREGVKAMGLNLFSSSPCNVVTAVNSPVDSTALVKKLRKEYGVSIAGGQMKLKGKIFRIAHLGYMENFDVIVGLSALEMGLKEMGYPVNLGAGVKKAEEIFGNFKKTSV